MTNKQIEKYKHYLNMLFKGHIYSVLCCSKAGLGKTHMTIELVKQSNIPYTYKSGITTPMALYKLLYDNRNGILILDDIETIFSNDYIINLLKAALWVVDKKRQISYKTSSHALDGYDDTFTYNGMIIFLVNTIKGKRDESFNALMSRCLKCEIIYTLTEIKKLSSDIIYAKQDINNIQKNKIVDIVYRTIYPQHNFNFRLLERLVEFVKYDINNAEDMFLDSLEIDYDLDIFLTIVKTCKGVVNQQIKFSQETGKSKSTFYRQKRKLKKEGLIK